MRDREAEGLGMSGEAGLRSRGRGGGREEEEARSEVWSFWSVVRDAVSWTEVVVLFSVSAVWDLL